MYQTGMGVNLLLMTVIGFVVGLSISGRTFYTFILENLERFGALKAIGMTSRELITMTVPSDVHGFNRLRPWRGIVHALHCNRQAAPAGLCGDGHVLEPVVSLL